MNSLIKNLGSAFFSFSLFIKKSEAVLKIKHTQIMETI